MSISLLKYISLLQENYHSQQHRDPASTLTTKLTSYNASARGINFYHEHEGMSLYGIEQQGSNQLQLTIFVI